MIKPRSSSLAPCINVTVDNCSISPSPQVKSLGVIFDRMHSFQEHISNITGSSYFHLHNINRLCPSYVDYTLIDYFNSILFGLALKSVHKLQLVQNFGACITRSLSISHITPVLQLHWPPVNYCDDFKILLLTFMATHNLNLQYLSKMKFILSVFFSFFSSSHLPTSTMWSSLQLFCVSPLEFPPTRYFQIQF